MERTSLASPIRAILACAALGLYLHVGWAEDVLAPRPEFVKGERWVYQRIDMWTDKVENKYEQVFAEVLDNKLVFRSKSLTSDEAPQTLYFSQDLNPCRILQSENVEICSGPFKFPLRSVGERWSFKKLPWRNGKGYYDADCELKTQEKVSTPAGEYDTLRIECKGFWQQTMDGSNSGRYEETFWYAPTVKRFVRSDFNTWTSGGRMDSRTRTELIEVQLK
ncbi:hypothetical protein [Hydrogenophilus thiooxidans]|uniref:hypothetical protein n=1 Tax=Hydrogenophilus thiooxidans TaxID=2820326 RepID=UPI001C236751|nr:hypothetical protein [Hydrogenophilus thiooxidans]